MVGWKIKIPAFIVSDTSHRLQSTFALTHVTACLRRHILVRLFDQHIGFSGRETLDVSVKCRGDREYFDVPRYGGGAGSVSAGHHHHGAIDHARNWCTWCFKLGRLHSVIVCHRTVLYRRTDARTAGSRGLISKTARRVLFGCSSTVFNGYFGLSKYPAL